MEATHPTTGWEKVGDKFYRKTQLYTAIFDQNIDLDSYIVAGAPYGGAIGKPVFHSNIIYTKYLHIYTYLTPLSNMS